MKNGGPAFPRLPYTDRQGSSTYSEVGATGMSLRDYFAAMAIVAAAHADTAFIRDDDEPKNIAKRAYALADEMLKARE